MPDNYLDVVAAQIRKRLEPSEVPANSEQLFRMYAVLAFGRGVATTDEDVHNAWVAWMVAEDPSHPSLVRFAQLDRDTRRSDRTYRDAIRDTARELGDSVAGVLLPNGPPTPDSREEFFELYRLMVASSEALVNRRQAVNTFFLTINGVLLTAIGLFIRAPGHADYKAGAVVAVAVAGVTLGYTWWSLLRSFGQLNTGKFAIINRMEIWLAASIYEAEWEALGRGTDRKVYKTFTSREAIVPAIAICVYGLTTIIAGLIALDIWNP